MLNECVTHKSQMVARLHGAEFAMLLPGVSCDDARKIAASVRAALAQQKIEHAKSDCSKHLTMSIGIGSQSVAAGSYSRELLVRVDTALKLAKERGHDRLEVLEA
jgi:two-component system chemotaxis family response regulator WspR